MIPQALGREELFQRYLKLSSLVKGGSVEPHWLSDGDSFWYVEGGPNDRIVYLVKPAAGSREILFDIERLRQALTEHLGHPPPYAGVPFEHFTLDETETQASFELDGRKLTLDLDTYANYEDPFPPSDAERARSEVRLVRPAFQTGESPSRGHEGGLLDRGGEALLRGASAAVSRPGWRGE